jgi:Ca-activated chloride channel family protein
LTFIDPGKLWLLLLVPALIAAYVLLQRRRRSYTMRFTNLELLAAVAPKRPGLKRHIPAVAMLLALLFLAGALARPTVERPVPKEQAGVLLVIDVSLSMAATDIAPDRITAAKTAAIDFIKALPAELKVGVVAFSELSALVSPLSHDRQQTELAVDSLAPVGGTAIGEGLFTALEEIGRVGSESTAKAPASVLLLSDGKWNRGRSPEDAATQAKAMNVKVFTVGLGTQGATLDLAGQRIPVDLDETELRTIAETTGGTYSRSADAESLREVYRGLGSVLGFEKEQQEVTAVAAGIAAALLVIAALASLIWFQRIP